MKITNTLASEFRSDYLNAMKALESKYGCSIDIGTIRWNGSTADNFRFKTTVGQPVRLVENFTTSPLSYDDMIQVGDSVIVDHNKAKNQVFTVAKINRKRMKLRDQNGQLWNTPISMIKKV